MSLSDSTENDIISFIYENFSLNSEEKSILKKMNSKKREISEFRKKEIQRRRMSKLKEFLFYIEISNFSFDVEKVQKGKLFQYDITLSHYTGKVCYSSDFYEKDINLGVLFDSVEMFYYLFQMDPAITDFKYRPEITYLMKSYNFHYNKFIQKVWKNNVKERYAFQTKIIKSGDFSFEYIEMKLKGETHRSFMYPYEHLAIREFKEEAMTKICVDTFHLLL